MVKKLSAENNKVSIAQIDVDLSNPEATELRRREAFERAEADGAAFVLIGGEYGRYEDDKYLFVTDDAVFKRDCRNERLAKLAVEAKAVGKILVYAGAVGVCDQGKSLRIYDGGSVIVTPDGKYSELFPKRFAEGFVTVDLDNLPALTSIPKKEEFDVTAEAIIFGIKGFLARLGISRIVIGVSGGIDSAVTSALYGAILPPEDILLVGMPGPYTSQLTRGLGLKLARNIGARFVEIPIQESVELTCRQFSELKSEGPGGGINGAWELSPFAIENVQARDRGSRILAAAAAVFGGVISCNANKDEISIGYGTLYGDILGWLAPLGDLWKGDVYALGRYLNEKVFNREVIPEGIFTIKPSAELSANQCVEKGLGDPLNYPYHDKLLRYWVEEGATPDDCVRRYLDGSLAETIGYEGKVEALYPNKNVFVSDIARWWNLYKGLAVAKRLQAPPILAVSKLAFGEFPERQSSCRWSL